MTCDRTPRSLLRRLDDRVLRGRKAPPGAQYGYGAKAGPKAEAVERDLVELQARVASLEARLSAVENAG